MVNCGYCRKKEATNWYVLIPCCANCYIEQKERTEQKEQERSRIKEKGI